MTDKRYEWAGAASAEILNLYFGYDQPKSILFQKLQDVIYGAMCMAAMEEKAELLQPSRN